MKWKWSALCLFYSQRQCFDGFNFCAVKMRVWIWRHSITLRRSQVQRRNRLCQVKSVHLDVFINILWELRADYVLPQGEIVILSVCVCVFSVCVGEKKTLWCICLFIYSFLLHQGVRSSRGQCLPNSLAVWFFPFSPVKIAGRWCLAVRPRATLHPSTGNTRNTHTHTEFLLGFWFCYIPQGNTPGPSCATFDG